MNKKTILILCVICSVAIHTDAQVDKRVLNYLNRNFDRLSLEYLIFFEPELIEFYSDSINEQRFKNEILRQTNWTNENSEEGIKERKIFLAVLRRRIENVKTIQGKSKMAMLNLLTPFKIEFSVNEELLEMRFNPKKRGLPLGDEECDTDFSFYIFFLYDPELYVSVLKNNRAANPSGKVKFPLTCLLEEQSHLPFIMKSRIQNELLKILNRYKGQEYDELKNKIRNADLNAKYD